MSVIVVGVKHLKHVATDLGFFIFHARTRPDPDLQNPLKFFRRVVPAVVVTEAVSWEIVLGRVGSAAAVREDVIGLPGDFNLAAANVAAVRGLAQNIGSLASSQPPSSNPRLFLIYMPLPTLLSESSQLRTQ